MTDETISTLPLFPGVMISSTLIDLKEHRAILIDALDRQEMYPIKMESYVLDPEDDVISASLKMVRKASAYIGLVSHRYGQVVESPLNPNGHSVSRLEFEEAKKRGLPTLVFVMSGEHKVKPADVETDPIKVGKLASYRDRVKAGRIYEEFDDLNDFAKKAIHAVGRLRRYLEREGVVRAPEEKYSTSPNPVPIPKAPAFYAEPPYIGSHKFVGRRSELEILSDWASPSESHPILLFEAIGGAGKSMLTWEWATKHAQKSSPEWAGIFWYSFYEKGAILADFCRRGLAYVTGEPFEGFRSQKTADLGERLLLHLRARPWLFILDGLERVLVHYHRFDASQLADEDAGTNDPIGHRDPCSAIRPEDDDLLRSLAAAKPSKLLITSRLIPQVLLNSSRQLLPDVLHIPLRGLRPADAEELFRASGVRGNSEAIQSFLQKHCDCHPLVTGVLTGLVNDYLPDRGDFDAWAADSGRGVQLNLADLDLIQKRNHILEAALAAVTGNSRGLLSLLALLSEAVDYVTLGALNSDLPPIALAEAIRDLEHRGLLQYDVKAHRYDLHPVVRGVAVGGLRAEEKEWYGQRVVDHFSRQVHNPYEQAVTLEDLGPGLHVVRSLLRMGQFDKAQKAYRGDLSYALLFNLEAHAEVLALLRPFFSRGWGSLPEGVESDAQPYLANDAAYALRCSGDVPGALSAGGAALTGYLRQKSWRAVRTGLSNIGVLLFEQKRLARSERHYALALDLAALIDDPGALFVARLFLFISLAQRGKWIESETLWKLLNPMGREWPRSIYRPGDAENKYALAEFWRGELKDEHIEHAERLAGEGKNRPVIRWLHSLRGEWRFDQGAWMISIESLREAIRMAREIGQTDAESETRLAMAKHQLGQLTDPKHEAGRLAKLKEPFHRGLAELWLEVGDEIRAKEHALAALRWAWADGEPYVNRYELDKSSALLRRLQLEVPKLPPYDPERDEKLPWEEEVVAAIEELRAEKAKEANEAQEGKGAEA